MPFESLVPADATALSRFDRIWLRLEAALNLLSGIVIFALVVMAVCNVLGRKLFNTPIPGYVDWTEQLMAAFAFLGLAFCQREGGHIRMDIVVGRIRGRILWLAELLAVVFMLLLATALIYGTWFHFDRSFDLAKPLWSTDSSIDIALPLWPAKLLVPFSMAILWVRLALQVWAYGRALRTGASQPVAVPLVEDPASVTAHEAQSVSGRDG